MALLFSSENLWFLTRKCHIKKKVLWLKEMFCLFLDAINCVFYSFYIYVSILEGLREKRQSSCGFVFVCFIEEGVEACVFQDDSEVGFG